MHDVLVIGVAGGTASGKTTVVEKIMERFSRDIALLELDSYYADLSHLPYDQRVQINFDHPSSLDIATLIDHIGRLKAGQPVAKPVYDFAAYTRSGQTSTIQPARLILVEGILIFAVPELRSQFDIKVFVDTAADIRLMRRIRRDIAERGRTLESVEKQYFATVRPMHEQFVEPSKQYADIIIPRGGENRVAIDMLTAKIASLLPG
ncbi:MAG: uridine kinase [Negativicutes bacterium]|nr:uridine kinase [Negativicutes bacterium]